MLQKQKKNEEKFYQKLLILKQLKKEAEDYIGKEVKKAVISVQHILIIVKEKVQLKQENMQD